MKNILTEVLDALLADTRAQGNPLRAALQAYKAALENRDKLEREKARLTALLAEAETSTRFDDPEFVQAVAAAPVQLRMITAQFTGHDMTGELAQATADLRREIADYENSLLERMDALHAKALARLTDKARKSFGIADDGQCFLWLHGENHGPFEGNCHPPYEKLTRAETVARMVFPHTAIGTALLKLPQSACYRFAEQPVEAAQGLLAWADALAKVEKLAAAL